MTMIVFIEGTSSSGKTSIMKKFSSKYAKVSADDFRKQGHARMMKSLKNKYYSVDEIEQFLKTNRFALMAIAVKSKKYAVVEATGSGALKHLPKKTTTVLLYTPIEELAKHMNSRKSIGEYRGNMVFRQFSEKYIKTEDSSESIDEVSIVEFIKILKTIKWAFTSEKNLLEFAKKTFTSMGINNDKKHYITHRKKNYDIVLMSDGKSTQVLYNKLIKILVDEHGFLK
jgi:shikimate kinase